MIDWSYILHQIQQSTGLSPDSRHIRRVTGGCINSSFLVGSESLQIFIKTNRPDCLPMFEAEAAGLNAIANTHAILSPGVLYTGLSKDVAFIAMQAIDLRNTTSRASYRKFGRQLADMHRFQHPRFGADTDNTIGSTPQHNPWSKTWFEFWRTHRLGFQLHLAREKNAPHEMIDDGLRLNEDFEALFHKQPKSSCLHGDLWQGNWGFTESGTAVIFDPAHYYGDRETDIAMTTLFGRANPEFYAAYNETYPLEAGYAVREQFYNLYHILNHYNLFGGSYASQAHSMIKNLLSELN